MRIGFTLLGGNHWTGGRNYLLNLFRVLAMHEDCGIVPVLLVGENSTTENLRLFHELLGDRLIRTKAFNSEHVAENTLKALALGKSGAVARELEQQGIDAVFESGQFYGWRFSKPCLTWIPDFQHRRLPGMFSRTYRWRRDLGYKIQVAAGRTIMLSSEDARRDCETFYPGTRGRTVVVPFAVPQPVMPESSRFEVRLRYGLPDNFLFLPNQFWKHKNHSIVIEALSVVRARGEALVVAASGNSADVRHARHFERLRERVRDLGLEENFRFIGMIPYGDVLALMAGCRAMINPSLFEGWSTTVEEGKALGVPLVLSDLAVHREQAGNRAVYFDPDSAERTADAMISAMSRFGGESCVERIRAAEPESKLRVAAYANAFAAAVHRTVQRQAASE